MKFFSNQIDLIFKKSQLRFLTWVLCLINLSTAIYWKIFQESLNVGANVCWPLFNSCENFVTPYLITAMLVTSALSILLLILQARSLVFPILTLTFLLKLSLYLLNYSFSHNIHVLIFFIEIALFTFPLKSINIKLIILLFIFWSGLSKLNLNWMSGLELKNYLPDLPIKGIEWVSTFVVILELVTPFILLSRIKIIFHYAWIGLVVYYLGYAFVAKNFLFLFPAMLMFYLVFYRQALNKQERERLYKSYHMPEPSRAWVALPMLLFALINWYPLASHPVQAFNNNPLKLRKGKVPLECLVKTLVKVDQSHHFLSEDHIQSNGNDFKCFSEKFKDLSNLCNLHPNYSKATLIRTMYSKELTTQSFTKNFHIEYNCLTKRFL